MIYTVISKEWDILYSGPFKEVAQNVWKNKNGLQILYQIDQHDVFRIYHGVPNTKSVCLFPEDIKEFAKDLLNSPDITVDNVDNYINEYFKF